MPIPKIVGAQRDFSSGELDVSMKRADESPVMKTGCRQMSNWRVLSSNIPANRPGRRALFPFTGRVEKVLMSPGNIFYLCFGNAQLSVYNAAGTRVFNSTVKGDGSTALPWTVTTARNIVFVVGSGSAKSIYITYGDDAPVNVPQVLTWDGVSQSSTWTLTTFAETIETSGQKRTPFYRISPQNITIQPSATTGSVTLTASASLFVSGMIGTRLRYGGRQIVITAVASGTSATATVVEPLPPSQSIGVSGQVGVFSIGDVVTGSVTGATGILTASAAQQTLNFSSTTGSGFSVGNSVSGGTSGATGIVIAVNGVRQIVVQLTSGAFIAPEVVTGPSGTGTTSSTSSATGNVVQLLASSTGIISFFSTSDKIVGPSGSATVSSQTVGAPQAISVWDDEVMNLFRGYPTSCFFDDNRLGLCNFPSLPSGIAWSAIGLPLDLYIAALPANAIFELAPGKSQVLFVIPGMEGSEFVFCDNAVYYIPITVNDPLVPGSVAFNLLSAQGCLANVKPQPAQQTILYMKAGATAVGAVQAPGAYYRPYIIDDVSEMHSHLFTASTAIAIAVQTSPSQFEEKYAYVLLANGSIVMGRYAMRSGLLDVGQEGKPKIGWLPWTGGGTSTWISAQSGDIVFTTSYAPNGVAAVSVAEVLDNTQNLDGALAVNNLPAPFTPPGGKGPLYNFPGPNSTVFLYDGARPMDVYTVDGNGNLIAQNIDGENLSSVNLVAGQPWTATLEPFVSLLQPGQDVGQRMKKRRATRFGAYVSQSTGFVIATLFSGPLTPTSPALGTVVRSRRVDAYNQGDDPTQPPPLREEAKFARPLGKAYDPRYAIIKDLPGSLLVHEIAMEATV